jgi:hypothetical protein
METVRALARSAHEGQFDLDGALHIHHCERVAERFDEDKRDIGGGRPL